MQCASSFDALQNLYGTFVDCSSGVVPEGFFFWVVDTHKSHANPEERSYE